MNKFKNLSEVTQLTIMDSILRMKTKGKNIKSIQNSIEKDFGYKLKTKTINNLSTREKEFKEFENLLTKNLIY
jgi:hypothetical protein